MDHGPFRAGEGPGTEQRLRTILDVLEGTIAKMSNKPEFGSLGKVLIRIVRGWRQKKMLRFSG